LLIEAIENANSLSSKRRGTGFAGPLALPN